MLRKYDAQLRNGFCLTYVSHITKRVLGLTVNNCLNQLAHIYSADV